MPLSRDLIAVEQGIESLEGIQAFTNLETLNLYRNFISDTTPLAPLTKLWDLDLGINLLTEIDGLAGLTALLDLYVDGNFLSDGVMQGAGSSVQYAPNGEVPPVLGPLANMRHLQFILLGGNEIVYLDPLASASRLAILGASSNLINNFSILSAWPDLFSLDVSDNPFNDLSPISAKTGLGELWAENLGLTGTGFLAPLTNLAILDLSQNDITNVTQVSSLSNLLSLDLSNNPVTGFAPIGSLNNLQSLALFNTGLGANQPASQGPSGNGSGELDFLTGLTLLEFLDLGVNQVQSLGPLSSLTALQTLLLDANNIADIAALVANPGLGEFDFIDLEINELGTDDCNNLETLLDRGVEIDHDVDCSP